MSNVILTYELELGSVQTADDPSVSEVVYILYEVRRHPVYKAMETSRVAIAQIDSCNVSLAITQRRLANMRAESSNFKCGELPSIQFAQVLKASKGY